MPNAPMPDPVPQLRPSKSRHGRITAVSMMKDEGPYLLEWVAHHLAVGFTDLVVYTNDCSDGTDLMLERLQALGLAHHRVNRISKGQKPQPSAIRHAQDDPLVRDSDWVMVFDADEFLCIRLGDGTLDTLLDAVTDRGANGIVVTWRIFGSGGVVDWSRDFVTEQYLMAAPPMWNKGWGVKTLFRFDPDAWKLGIHRPKMRNKVLDTDYPSGIRWLNGSGHEMEDYFKFRGWRSIVRTVGYDWAQMNHYAVKSIDSFAIRRLRGNVNNKADKYDDAYWALQDRNEVRDDTMLRSSVRRRDIFDALLGDPILSDLHHAALDRVEARLAEIKSGPHYAPFAAKLRAASQVPITRVEAKPPKPRDAATIADKMKDVERRVASDRREARAKTPEARALAPVEVYAGEIPDTSLEPALEWYRNHSVLLPCDPRVFAPPGLLQIAERKFERNLARNVPKLLPPGARYLELGAACGFVGTHLALSGANASVTLQEGSPDLRRIISRIWQRNGLVPSSDLRLLDDAAAASPDALVATVADTAPNLLALGCPALAPADVAPALAACSPAIVALTGRLWPRAFATLDEWEDMLRARGYVRRLPIDPASAALYDRGPAPE